MIECKEQFKTFNPFKIELIYDSNIFSFISKFSAIKLFSLSFMSQSHWAFNFVTRYVYLQTSESLVAIG